MRNEELIWTHKSYLDYLPTPFIWIMFMGPCRIELVLRTLVRAWHSFMQIQERVKHVACSCKASGYLSSNKMRASMNNEHLSLT